VKSVNFDVYAGVKFERVDIGEEGVEKIVAEALALAGIEAASVNQVRDRRRENSYFHSERERKSRLATAQSTDFSSPAS
jgi:hypothetical protein